MFTILLPFTRPIFIITAVEIILHIIFWPVPDFIRELPVTYSGPTTISIGMSDTADIGASGLDVMDAVNIPRRRHSSIAEITYGVVPDAAMQCL